MLALQRMTQTSGIWIMAVAVTAPQAAVLRREQKGGKSKDFRAHVVRLMQAYADFDVARAHYRDPAASIADGVYPEDVDLPFYTARLN